MINRSRERITIERLSEIFKWNLMREEEKKRKIERFDTRLIEECKFRERFN